MAQGATEVLILEKDDIMALRFNNQGLPFEYLKREFDLFKTFPFSTEIDLSELIMYQYFGYLLMFNLMRSINRDKF